MEFNIVYEFTGSFVVTVTRDKLPSSHEALLESVTKEEISLADLNPVEWGHIKDAWRCSTPVNTTVFDEDNNQLY